MTLNWALKHGSSEWLEARARNIGGSEIASLYGVQEDFAMSAYTLHMVKSGRMAAPPVDDSPGSRVWMGKRLEPTIAQMGAEMFGWKDMIQPGPYAVDDLCEGMAASLDGVIHPGPREQRAGYEGPGLLEVKFSQWLAHKRSWTNDEPPYQVVVQAQHGLACSGYRWGIVLVLIGELGLKVYRYRARPNIADDIRRRVAEFWANVRAGNPPNTDGSRSTGDALRALYPEHGDAGLDLRGKDEADVAAAAFTLAREHKNESDDVYQGTRNQILGFMMSHSEAETDNYWISIDKRGAVRVSEKPQMPAFGGAT